MAEDNIFFSDLSGEFTATMLLSQSKMKVIFYYNDESLLDDNFRQEYASDPLTLNIMNKMTFEQDAYDRLLKFFEEMVRRHPEETKQLLIKLKATFYNDNGEPFGYEKKEPK